MLWSTFTTSPSRWTRTSAAYSSEPRRTSAASASASWTIPRPSAPAASVRPRSSMRNAACSCAFATIRSDSCCARSRIRSPSALIRRADWTSSGTAWRNSSTRSRAAAWSTTTFDVSGSFLPLAIIASRRSTKNMISMGPPSARGRRGRPVWDGLSHADGRLLSRGHGHQALRHRRRDHSGRVAAEADDLPDQAGREVAVFERRHEEDRIDLRSQPVVHVGHLELRLEVAHGPQPANHVARAQLAAGVYGQAGERTDVHAVREIRERLPDAGDDRSDAPVNVEHGCLLRVDEDGDHDALEDAQRASEHVQVPERDGIERAGVDRDTHRTLRLRRRTAVARLPGRRAGRRLSLIHISEP